IILQVLAQLVEQLLRDHAAVLHGLEQCLLKLLHGAFGIELIEVVVMILESTLQQKIPQKLEQVLRAQAFKRVAAEFRVLDELHSPPEITRGAEFPGSPQNVPSICLSVNSSSVAGNRTQLPPPVAHSCDARCDIR